MDIEIFVHGVPNGQSFWGKEEDRNYFGNFYGQSCSDVVKYLIQTRSSNGKTYCYYNYLMLVLNLGHNPLYRHFCKYLYIEMLKILLVY